ncbi:MAG: ferrochelatase, partial [Deltaproteobacteria bacterium]|nr:ferrochelatase [Deltaproteobacteria bacterium]
DAEDVCIFLPLHGLVDRLVKEGDPYVPQVMRVIDELKQSYGAHRVSYGYQNHDEIPFIRWTQPTTDKALAAVAASDCRGVLINGGVSFTVDSLETLYDHRVDEPARLAEEARRLGRVSPRIVVQPMFNAASDFVALMATIVREALVGQGDLESL